MEKCNTRARRENEIIPVSTLSVKEFLSFREEECKCGQGNIFNNSNGKSEEMAQRVKAPCH